ncbi:hypothetical protein ANOM_008420 [Aspergillus nomiae NRRL 13137]|uniref:Uncharacterized protein n=1 Tax=Aspergillus nomiae NRRL (strain ATCC 15546 / NRRL 13137 / CBS 260.88 / M93) TaxID=1509407 RepID=A0A0L1IYM6_ASPN3|nr:uncharacterized protein ANOM_008420 [Aspergillus nomiae NRRL 13137]KNG84495.1 hypothetical protein ANOM_008420 [Aspergillus nomiae NRRL 13137]
MPPKRVRRTASTTQKPPSPPLSEKNAPVADENVEVEAPDVQERGSMGSPRNPRHNEPPMIMDEDEEMPEESGDTVQLARPEYAGGAGRYNMLKSYKGQVYSGMAVGGSHTWNYDQGVWKETKEEPDLWRIDYQTNKRRARKAPEGSGAPVGTEYHWLIVAHQFVKKIDANTYETNLTGSKYKLAYKSASSNSWSVPTVKKQRDREVELLEDAKQRVQGLPPVLASEKVKVAKPEKGQQKLDRMFTKAAGGVSKKRKLGEDSGG